MITERPYNTIAVDKVEFFIGTEVEKTPAYGLKTLFVVGIQDPTTIFDLSQEYQVEHIYLGANQSFLPYNQYEKKQWSELLDTVVRFGPLVTLDFDIVFKDEVRSFNCTKENFIPMISVKIPHIGKLSQNACIKIDDIDFDSTNTGVWVHRIQNLTSEESYTPWSKYTNDMVIKGETNG